MLQAEIHGKRIEEVQNSEDFLTSAVFGHLRYVVPSTFWDELFSQARTIPFPNAELTLREVLAQRGIKISNYLSLRISFWPNWGEFGEPDLLLTFSGGNQLPLLVAIEVKLNSEKSSQGKDDQLAKYLSGLQSASIADLPSSAFSVLVYLTPHESIQELRDSLRELGTDVMGDRLFRLQWQDVYFTAKEVEAKGQAKIILEDVAEFLLKRGLRYFSGFREDAKVPILTAQDGAFYISSAGFHGFEETQEFKPFEIENAGLTLHSFAEKRNFEPFVIIKGAWTHHE